MKTITISKKQLTSTMTLEETLWNLNLIAGSQYGGCFPLVLKLDMKNREYTLTMPGDNEESLPIAWIGNYNTNNRQEYTALMLKKVLEDATKKLANEGLELWCNSLSWVTNPCDYTILVANQLLNQSGENKKGMNKMKNLPNLTISGRIYTPATTFENMTAYILEWFEDESYEPSTLVSDLSESFVSLVFKLDNEKGTYAITFSGDKDEFAVIEGPILSRDMVKAGVLRNSVETLNESLQNGVDYWPNGREWFHDMEPQLIYA